MKPADRAWLTLAGGVVAWDVLADETLSAAVDRILIAHPILGRAVIAVVALHLSNAMPERLDPLNHLFALLRRWRPLIPQEIS